MKYFFTGTFLTLALLISFFVYKQNIGDIASLPYDDEQHGLGDQIIIHFSHVVAENTPKGLAAIKFAELVKEKTNGRVIVQVYPNGILYSDDNEFEALQQNEIQMIAPTFSKVTSYLPSWQVLDLPFIIETDEQLKEVLTGPLKEQLLAELDGLNIKGLDFWSNGFKQIASNDYPVQNVQDFQLLRVRVMASELISKQFSLLGSTPITTTFDDVYYEIEKRNIQAQENTISNLYSKGFHKYEKHITLSNHGIMGYAVMINKPFWDSLDAELQQPILEALQEMSDWQFETSIEMNQIGQQELSSLPDVSLYPLSPVQKKAWKEKVAPIYETYQKEINDSYYKLLIEEVNRSN
ncbi:DctP family TRAP transporter solute-binding subunit [Lysinibacillus odysseyi]|uniref:C4-dicarboxylate ABC transporter n=1 Tax=Lysinibacillus odysseyi 34hs-1 = NBRC 100172 TaxID=1220589 RepID=A0A0A3IJ15_9BACI|nr:DctP family TRAP transporter solute-binding subunit [Lysinibacillus odysseyi]KGR83470.1 C4-dicarboxylate ABC transporter [Lysinibacillus odysseyi 34hs-1 = NBRC 100172]